MCWYFFPSLLSAGGVLFLFSFSVFMGVYIIALASWISGSNRYQPLTSEVWIEGYWILHKSVLLNRIESNRLFSDHLLWYFGSLSEKGVFTFDDCEHELVMDDLHLSSSQWSRESFWYDGLVMSKPNFSTR